MYEDVYLPDSIVSIEMFKSLCIVTHSTIDLNDIEVKYHVIVVPIVSVVYVRIVAIHLMPKSCQRKIGRHCIIESTVQLNSVCTHVCVLSGSLLF